MKPKRTLSRRSFLGRVAGAVAAGGALGTVGAGAHAQQNTGITDTDSGSRADNACQGRGGPGSRACEGAPGGPARWTGVTDRDSGSNSDNAGYGRGGSGSGPYQPPIGGPPVHTGITGSDSGARADSAGYGTGRSRRQCTDSDAGAGRDPAYQGRRC